MHLTITTNLFLTISIGLTPEPRLKWFSSEQSYIEPCIHRPHFVSIQAKKQQEIAVGLTACQVDDPWLVMLDAEYVGKLCFLHDISLRHKLYRICKIAYWESTRKRNASREATMEPVHVSPECSVFIHDDDTIVMSAGRRLTKASALICYVLAEYVDGDEAEPIRTNCVDKYVMDSLEKKTSRTRQKPPATANRLPTVRTSLSPPRPSRPNRRVWCRPLGGSPNLLHLFLALLLIDLVRLWRTIHLRFLHLGVKKSQSCNGAEQRWIYFPWVSCTNGCPGPTGCLPAW